MACSSADLGISPHVLGALPGILTCVSLCCIVIYTHGRQRLHKADEVPVHLGILLYLYLYIVILCMHIRSG